MSADYDEMQRTITRAALRALGGTRFALAGSGAIREHGIIDRPTEDIDLFTSDVDADRFNSAVSAVITELRSTGHDVDELRRVEQFAHLHVTTPGGRAVEIDMGVDSREDDPVTLSVGPVLSLGDAVGNKVSALYSRAEVRDFLDVDSIRGSGKYTDSDLIESARERDPGFEVPTFVVQLEQAQCIRPERVAEYGLEPVQLDALKQRFERWAADLTPPEPDDGRPTTPDPELQRIVELNKRNFPTSATEIGRSPVGGAPGTRAHRPPQQGLSTDRGYGR